MVRRIFIFEIEHGACYVRLLRSDGIEKAQSSRNIRIGDGFIPFNHPRLAVSEFDRTVKYLAQMCDGLAGKNRFLIIPVIVIVKRHLVGGLSDVEELTLLQLIQQLRLGPGVVLKHSPASFQEAVALLKAGTKKQGRRALD